MDETQPLLAEVRIVDTERCDEVSRKDIVDFNGDGDAENPVEWPAAYKWGVVLLLSFTAFTVYVITSSENIKNTARLLTLASSGPSHASPSFP